MKRVLIIGGGISGLAAAHFLRLHSLTDGPPIQCSLVERSPHFGGLIRTEKVDSFIIEGGPDSFISQKPWALDLCRQLGLNDQLIPSNDGLRKTYVLCKGKLIELPDGIMLMAPTKVGPFLRSPLISWPGKLRMALDWVLPAKSPSADETVASFVRRRLGREALEKIAEPLIGGIYGADVEQLSLRSTFPMFLDMEARHGSLLRGLLRRPSLSATSAGNSTSLFVTLRGGLSDLVKTLIDRLDGVELLPNRHIVTLTRAASTKDALPPYRAMLADGSEIPADALVLAMPAPRAAEILRAIQPSAANRLEQVPYTSAATISLAFARRDLAAWPVGFGFVVPHAAMRPLIACTWSSNKFSFRSDSEHLLVRGFAGGAHNSHLVDLDDDALVSLLRAELQAVAGIIATPILARVFRWRQAMPQYPLGHADQMARVQEDLAATPGLFLAGNAYNGIGLPDCINSGAQAARQVINYLKAL
ncbi:MAG: protoporphyrinogen oxidase [Acidobacteria bacterium]|nr:protoporphyrinogen oxidase [Acidobacteriota bacterium]MBI3655255.1 protoporphyrinogen oxidase [Acidobacteriota bacterium]